MRKLFLIASLVVSVNCLAGNLTEAENRKLFMDVDTAINSIRIKLSGPSEELIGAIQREHKECYVFTGNAVVCALRARERLNQLIRAIDVLR